MTTAPLQPISRSSVGGRLQLAKVQEQFTGYLFILPAVLLVFLFGVFPIGYAFYMSLRRWRVRDRGYIGLDNYVKALGDWVGSGLFLMGSDVKKLINRCMG